MAAFMMTWGDYLFSITLISDNRLMTVGAGLNSRGGEQGLAYGHSARARLARTQGQNTSRTGE
jgi:ABC-type glycerol-3-phosphate transport system permease component